MALYLKPAQITCNVKGKSMHRYPFANPDANRRDFPVLDPDARLSVDPVSPQPKIL